MFGKKKYRDSMQSNKRNNQNSKYKIQDNYLKGEWVKVALRPSNTYRLYMDEKSTEKGEVN